MAGSSADSQSEAALENPYLYSRIALVALTPEALLSDMV